MWAVLLQKYWKVIAMGCMLLTILFLYKRLETHKQDRKRANNTITELQRKDDVHTKEIILNKKQFEQAISEKHQWMLDSMEKKVKIKEVVKIQNKS